MDHPGRDRPAGMVTPPERHRQALLDEADVLDRRCRPADDGPGEQVDGERDIDESAPGRDIGEVRHPGPVRGDGRKSRFSRSRARRPSLPGMVVRVLRPRTSPFMPSAASAGPPCVWRCPESRSGAARRPSSAARRAPPAAGRPARRFRSPQLGDDRGVAESGQPPVLLPGPVRSRGDLHALRPQDLADRLDRATFGPHLTSTNGRSTAARVEFPREENRAALQDRVGFLQVPVLGAQPLDLCQFFAARARRSPASIWAWTTHRRNVSGPTSSFGAKALQAAKTDG